jgi:RND family efflux transporter MFP subunit
VTIVLVGACGGGGSPPDDERAVVDTASVEAMDVPTVITAVGTVEADHQTTVSSEVRGQVARIIHDEGSRVAAGTPVIQLDPGPHRFAEESAAADVSKAEAQLAADERLLERYEQLLEAGAIDLQTYENLEAQVVAERAVLQQARAALNTARWDLDKTRIRAPFEGTVGRRHVQLGEYVDAQQWVFDLVDAEPVRIRFSVPEVHAGRVEIGDAVVFRVRSDTVSARQAAIDYVSPEIDPPTRTFEATAAYDNVDGAVLPGAYADVSVTVALHEGAPVVPEEALYTEGDFNYVFVVAEGPIAEKRRIEIGSRFDGTVELREGVRPGEVVIIAGQHGLPDGAPIQIVEDDGQTLERE